MRVPSVHTQHNRHSPAFLRIAALGVVALLAACGPAQHEPPEQAQPAASPARPGGLISRKALFANPVQFQGRISPDGAKVSWLALRDGALNLFVADADGQDTPRQVTFGKDGVEYHRWTPNSAYILFVRASKESGTSRVFALNVQTGAVRDLVPVNEGDAVWLAAVSANWPNTALVRLRRKGMQYYDLYRVDLKSGRRTLIARNPGFDYWLTDSDFVPRLGVRRLAGGGQVWVLRAPDGREAPLLTLAAHDALRSRPLRLDNTSTGLYLIDGREGPFSSLKRVDLLTGEADVLATGKDGDISRVLFHPVTGEPLAYLTTGPVPRWHGLSSGFSRVLDHLQARIGPHFFILALTNTAQKLVVYSDRADQPGRYSLDDLPSGRITTLFETMPGLVRAALNPTRLVRVKARDGLQLAAYLTPARSKEPGKQPLLVMPQPGSGARLGTGFNQHVQWLSNRGYNVLAVNTRGASGLGRAYANPGTGQSAEQAAGDLADAVRAVAEQGLADTTHIAGLGWGGGGRIILDYAATAGPALKCTLVLDPVLDRVAAGQIRTRLLVLQSAANPRLDAASALGFVKAVRGHGGDAAFVYFPEQTDDAFDGPAFLPLAALSEAFLADCLGGQAEPVGDSLDTLTFEVNAGPGGVPGLELP